VQLMGKLLGRRDEMICAINWSLLGEWGTVATRYSVMGTVALEHLSLPVRVRR
jgi:hypothetical protein